jgi:hypothetical protein
VCLLAEKANGHRRKDNEKAYNLRSRDRTPNSFSKLPLIFFENAAFFSSLLVLLCYKRFGPQKGQHGSCRMIACAITTRRVAIEIGL